MSPAVLAARTVVVPITASRRAAADVAAADVAAADVHTMLSCTVLYVYRAASTVSMTAGNPRAQAYIRTDSTTRETAWAC